MMTLLRLFRIRLALALGGCLVWSGLFPALDGSGSTTNIAGAKINRPAGPNPTNGLVARVPFELAGNHIFVPVRVNGAGPYSFVLDTGSSSSCVNQNLAEDLKLKAWPFSWRAEGVGGWTRLKFRRGVQLEVGGVKRTPVGVGSIALPDVGQRPMDGILGADWFHRFIVALDFPARELRLYDPLVFRPSSAMAELSLRFHRRLPFIQSGVGGVHETLIPGQFLIDSGYSGWLSLTDTFVTSNHLFSVAGTPKPERGYDVVGALERLRGQVPFVKLGPFTLPHPTTHFEAHPTLHPEDQTGVIGTGLLRRFDLVFDYPHRRLFLQPNADFSQPFDRRWTGTMMRVTSHGFRLLVSGAELVAAPPEYDRFQVAKIQPGSPADQAGLRRGDVILALNDKPLAALSLEQWLDLSWQSGHVFQVELQRGQERLIRPLQLDWEWYAEKPARSGGRGNDN